MGMTSDWAIELHNEQLASDAEYAENYFREEAEYQAWFEWREEMDEKQIDWFSDYRIDFRGYEEKS